MTLKTRNTEWRPALLLLITVAVFAASWLALAVAMVVGR